jgi:hypothetical protein
LRGFICQDRDRSRKEAKNTAGREYLLKSWKLGKLGWR